MNENAEEKNSEKKNSNIKVWHIIAAAVVFLSGIMIAASGVTAGFIPVVIDLLCALHILFPDIMVRRALKDAVRSKPEIANIVRIGAIIIAVSVDILHLI